MSLSDDLRALLATKAAELNPDRDTRRGFSGAKAAELAGITYRQLDYWTRTGLIVPSISAAKGSGTRRRFSVDDVRLLMLLGRVEPRQRSLVATAVRSSGGSCRWMIVNTATDAVFCGTTHEEILEAVRSSKGVLTFFDLDSILPGLVDA